MPADPVKLRLPPGMFKQGTDYAAAGRWLDGNLVRWENGILKTMGGTQKLRSLTDGSVLSPLYSNPAVEAIRSGIFVVKVDGTVSYLLGSNLEIYQVSQSLVKTVLTPAAFVDTPLKDASVVTGYGRFSYGTGKYGTRRPSGLAGPAKVFTWGFDAWGDWPVAVARGRDYRVFIKLPADALFTEIETAPKGANDLVVTDEQHLMLVATTDDSRLVSWSSREDYTVWSPSATNTAGSRRLSGSGELLVVVKMQGLTLIIGENDAFVGQYLGPPFVYGFNRVGEKCGVVSSNAVASTASFAMWYGEGAFWLYDGTLQQIPCDLLEFFALDLDVGQQSKISAFSNTEFKEVWWCYQSTSSVDNECDSYIAYNYKEKVWYCGRMARTLMLDKISPATVTGICPDGYLHSHEIPNVGHEGQLPYVESGPLEVQSGGRLLGMSYIIPDEEPEGTVSMRLSVRDFPSRPPHYFRDFTLTSPTPTTGIMGRDIRVRLTSTGNLEWSLGDLRVIPIAGASPRR